MRFRLPAPGSSAVISLKPRKMLRGIFVACCAAVMLTAVATTARAQNFADDSRWELGGHYALLFQLGKALKDITAHLTERTVW